MCLPSGIRVEVDNRAFNYSDAEPSDEPDLQTAALRLLVCKPVISSR